MAKERGEREEEDLVRLYLTDIGQYPLLTKDDEVRLAQAIEEGKKAGIQIEAGGKDLTTAKKRELKKIHRSGEDAERTFVQSNLEKKTETSSNAGDFLQKRIADLQSEIRTGEEQLINYAKNHQILSLDASQNTVVDRLTGLNKQLLEVG